MKVFYPGATLGILGGGQLGWMLALAAQQLGYRSYILDPGAQCPAQRVAEGFIQGAFDDTEAALDLARHADLVTLETEHIPHPLLTQVESLRPLRPGAQVLETIQDRLSQRAFLSRHGFPQTAYLPVGTGQELEEAATRHDFPAILKSRHGGYDGKSQVRVDTPKELAAAWETLGKLPAILEKRISFTHEISVILARGLRGEIKIYPLAENVHRHHVLHTTAAPARVSPRVAKDAQAIAAGIAAAMDYCGVMTVEMFLLADETLLVNEIAPRVHNSGHYTWGACATSQFEQHLRAICGLPLGDVHQAQPAVMLNLLGDVWQLGTPDWAGIFQETGAHLTLYGKEPLSPRRKMGHILIRDDQLDRALDKAESLHQRLTRQTPAARQSS